MSVRCGGRGLEIAGYKKRCSISELPVVISIFSRSVTLCFKRDFRGPLKENKEREKMA